VHDSLLDLNDGAHTQRRARPGSRDPAATVVISTRDRRDEVCRAARSALTQSVPVEVIVFDDGSTDGTQEMLARELPQVRLYRDEPARGSLVRRNQGIQLATASIVVSMDDDSELVSPRTVEQVLSQFDDPRIAALTIPFVDAPRPDRPRQQPPDDGVRYATHTYLGCAAALRRDAFLAVGGYRTSLLHSCEEPDLCLRLLAHGWLVALGRADPMVHHQSHRRSPALAVRYQARNELLIAWYSLPSSVTARQIARSAAAAVWRSLRTRRPVATCAGLLGGLAEAWRRRAERQPISPALGRLYWRLERESRRGYVTTLEEVASEQAAARAPSPVLDAAQDILAQAPAA
jgi:GT2 family glycosyltransferase